MPELPEVEAYRVLAEQVVGRRITGVEAPDAWYLKGGISAQDVASALRGRTVAGARRAGKLLLLDTADGPTLGIRFGMTGRLVVDGVPGVESLLYTSNADRKEWERFGLLLDRGRLVVRDPRRLGGVFLDPPEGRLGPDARTISTPALRAALAGGTGPLKARLMDQARVAGVGNLIADEALWRAGLDPGRPAGGLDDASQRALARALRRTIEDLIERGGSHRGDLVPARMPGGRCPRDGTALVRRTIGGRTTWSCPAHQV